MTIKEKIERKINFKTKPVGSLGLLEELALKIGTIQNTTSPELNNPAILVFAADHGIADAGVSPYPKDVTWQMVMNFVSGGAAINVFCRQNNIHLQVVDAGVDYDFPVDLPVINAKIDYGTRNMLEASAMTTDQCEGALEKGAELVNKYYNDGCNIIGFGEMGIGNTSSSSLLMSAFTGINIDECVGSGAGMVGEALEKKKLIIKTVYHKYSPKSALEKLAVFGGFEIAMMTGAYIEAFKKNMVILVDGFISSAALVAATAFENEITKNCIFCHHSAEQAGRVRLRSG